MEKQSEKLSGFQNFSAFFVFLFPQWNSKLWYLKKVQPAPEKTENMEENTVIFPPFKSQQRLVTTETKAVHMDTGGQAGTACTGKDLGTLYCLLEAS